MPCVAYSRAATNGPTSSDNPSGVSHSPAEEVALGDFVLSGGEIPALAVVDAAVRLLPGAISDHESASTDSFYEGLLSPPPPAGAHHLATGAR